MIQKTKGIVLHSIKHSESAIISHIFTESLGRQSFIAHGARKKKGTTSGYLFQPLSLVEIEIDVKGNRNIHRIIEAKNSYTLNQLYFDIRRSTIAIFLGEVLYRNIRETEPNKPLFDFIYNAVQLLDVAEKGVENFHLIFLVQLTKFLGFYPGNEENVRVEFQIIMNKSLGELDTLSISNDARQKLLESTLKLYEQHITGTGQIKSLKILREVFS